MLNMLDKGFKPSQQMTAVELLKLWALGLGVVMTRKPDGFLYIHKEPNINELDWF